MASEYPQQDVQDPAIRRDPDPTTCPPTYLLLAIIGLLIGMVPLALAALIYSVSVKKVWKAGYYSEALQNSKRAKIWGIVTIVTGVILWTIAVIAIVSNQ